MIRKIVLFCVLFVCLNRMHAQKEEIFPSLDGLMIHAHLYESDVKETKVMLLCHQARWSKGEYKETAPKFNKMGYTCLAIDQRSGDSINGVINQTKVDAVAEGKSTEFEDAEQDIKAALYFLYEKYGKKVTLVGSSYSSALVLKVAADEEEKVEKVISFSPGEYFSDPHIINKSMKKLEIPVYITCSKEEIKETTPLFDGVLNKKAVFFKPSKEGRHGSRALWNNYKHNKEYWESLTKFLK